MKWVYVFLMLLLPTLGVAQMDEKVKAALKERVIKEYRANLYGRLLNQITKGCKKCRDELLIWYRDHSDQNREDGKRLRTNAIRIMAYFADPNRLD